jgi:hypothetical protein
MNKFTARRAPVMALGLLLIAPAQAGQADPPDPGASAALRYESAFVDYKPWQDLKPGRWRELNDALAPDARRSAGPATMSPPATPTTPASATGTATATATATTTATAASSPANGAHGHGPGHPMHGGRR